MKDTKLDYRVRMTRDWTFQALADLLMEHDYHAISISDLVQKTGISRSTFYRHFYNKEDIIVAKVNDFYTSFFNKIKEHFLSNVHQDEVFMVEQFINALDKEDLLMDVILKTKTEKLMIDGILQLIDQHIKVFYRNIPKPQPLTTYTVHIVAATSWTMLSLWYQNGKKESIEELKEMYLKGIQNMHTAFFGSIDQIR